MRESFLPNNNLHNEIGKNEKELTSDEDVLSRYEKYHFDGVEIAIKEVFGKNELPTELIDEMEEIRNEIIEKIKNDNFVDEIKGVIDEKVKYLMAKIVYYKDGIGDIVDIEEVAEEGVYIVRGNGEKELIGRPEEDLLQSLRMYFDSFKMIQNAEMFRGNVEEIKETIISENKNRKINFYSVDEKDDLVFDKIKEKYKNAGFKDYELKELIRISDFSQLAELEIHEIKTMAKVKDIFSRFMKGDTSKYIALSAALTIPAFLEGYAPMFLSEAFNGDKIEMSQVAMYALLSSVSAGGGCLNWEIF